MFKLEPRMSTFQWNKLHLKIRYGSKVMVKKQAKVIFQYRFQSDLSTFELWLLPNYCELFNYPWLTYVKLIIRAGYQNLLRDTKCGVYKCWQRLCENLYAYGGDALKTLALPLCGFELGMEYKLHEAYQLLTC